jgi:hypothetical protein
MLTVALDGLRPPPKWNYYCYGDGPLSGFIITVYDERFSEAASGV